MKKMKKWNRCTLKKNNIIKFLDESFAIPEEIKAEAYNTRRDVDYFGYHKNWI